MLLVFIKRYDSVSEGLYFVFRFDQIYHLYVIALQRRSIDALTNYMFLGLLIRIWFSVRRFIFCVSFRQNISPLTLNTLFLLLLTSVIAMQQRWYNIVHIVCCLYSLNGYDSVSEDLYFVFRFDKIYLCCHWKHQFSVIHMQIRRRTILLMIDFLELL